MQTPSPEGFPASPGPDDAPPEAARAPAASLWRRRLPAVVALALLAILFAQADAARLGEALAGADPGLLLIAFVLQWGALLLQGWRWRVLLASDGAPWPLGGVMGLHFRAAFFDIFTPGRIGSDLYRLSGLPAAARHHGAATLLLMRVQGLAANLTLLILAALLLQGGALLAGGALTAALLLGPVLIIALLWGGAALGGRLFARWRNRPGRWGRLAGHGAQVAEAWRGATGKPATLIASTLIALFFVLWSTLVFAVVGAAVGLDLPWQGWLLGVPAIMIAIVLPITVHGRGLAEAAALLIWRPLGGELEEILLVTLGVYAIHLLQSLCAGLLVLRRRQPLAPPSQ